jgi:murein DD-endopeptidase MepM/ murein hydrolase activator NlpD
LGGWKNKNCLNGDIGRYIEVLKYWIDRTAQTQAWKDGRILGGQLFTSGAPGGKGGTWANFDLVQPEMGNVARAISSYTPTYPDQPQPPQPPKPPVPQPSRGAPRVQYPRVYLCVPQDASRAEWDAVCALAYDLKRTVGFSADDACVGDLDSRHAIFYGLSAGERGQYADWVAQYYPGVHAEYREFPEMPDETFWIDAWPCVTQEVTQLFGENVEYYKKIGLQNGHNGVDFGCVTGEPVFAVQGGVIEQADVDNSGYGLHIRIEHDAAWQSRYAHLQSIKTGIYEGVHVQAGDVIGYADNSGFSTGPHLHFELRRNGVAVDPLPYLEDIT